MYAVGEPYLHSAYVKATGLPLAPKDTQSLQWRLDFVRLR